MVGNVRVESLTGVLLFLNLQIFVLISLIVAGKFSNNVQTGVNRSLTVVIWGQLRGRNRLSVLFRARVLSDLD